MTNSFKSVNNKIVMMKNYAPGNNVWLNSKYVKTKQNQKLESKFFKFFQVLHLVVKQAYKLEF